MILHHNTTLTRSLMEFIVFNIYVYVLMATNENHHVNVT